jgi:hypothetical protein
MHAVVSIHNAVNERAWRHVLSWEALHACDCPDPKLLRFRGRPADYSPKARLLNLLVRARPSGPRLGYERAAPAAVLPRERRKARAAVSRRARPPRISAGPARPAPAPPRRPLPQGYKLPFDRHDWVVDRCGSEVRYVIDFYSGAPAAGAQASMHLDVRPALDSFGAALDRLRMQWRWVASGRWRDE